MIKKEVEEEVMVLALTLELSLMANAHLSSLANEQWL